MFADLHLHTNFSDGTYTPEELAGHAHRLGFSAVALTDHDTMEGCPRMAAACVTHGIEFVPGSELTCEHERQELHILGYFLDTANEKLCTALAKFQEVRVNRIREMVARINALGVKLDVQMVFDIANCRAPGRPHIGRALVQLGICSGMDEAFDRFLKKGKPAWMPKYRMTAAEAIDLIHQAGGLASLAHPGLYRADHVIPGLVAAGMDGLECFYTKHSTPIMEHYMLIADKHRLLVTGGSDCHGMNKGQPLIGSTKLPYQFVELLKKRVAARRAT